MSIWGSVGDVDTVASACDANGGAVWDCACACAGLCPTDASMPICVPASWREVPGTCTALSCTSRLGTGAVEDGGVLLVAAGGGVPARAAADAACVPSSCAARLAFSWSRNADATPAAGAEPSGALYGQAFCPASRLPVRGLRSMRLADCWMEAASRVCCRRSRSISKAVTSSYLQQAQREAQVGEYLNVD